MVVMGTRPEVIKMAPVIFELRKYASLFETLVVATAQHRQLLDQALDIFKITSDYDLDLMQPNQSLSLLAGRILGKMDEILCRVEPGIVLVQGDTTTVFAASLAAFHRKIPVAHIEAGLRSNDPDNPFPEEANRRLTSVLAAIHFAPTSLAKEYLRLDNVSEKKIVVTGNTVVDALQYILKQPFSIADSAIRDIPFGRRRTVLITSHRRETQDQGLSEICKAVKILIQKFPDIQGVFPVHPNPNVLNIVQGILGSTERIHLLPPLDYLTFLHLMKMSFLVLTDSGGAQEEAPSLCDNLLVLRQVTERPEAYLSNIARVIGTSSQVIVREASRILESKKQSNKRKSLNNPYGDGRASKRIVKTLHRWALGKMPLLEPTSAFPG